MNSAADEGDANSIAGDFGETWLRAVASGCGHLHAPSTTLDLEKGDVMIVLRGQVGRTYNPRVLVQVKTTTNRLPVHDGHASYGLDVVTYNVLRQYGHSTRRILAVFEVSDPGDRVRLQADGTLLVGRGLWVSLEGEPETKNAATQVVRLPLTNTLDAHGIRRMLTEFGVNSSTPVPDVHAWGEGA